MAIVDGLFVFRQVVEALIGAVAATGNFLLMFVIIKNKSLHSTTNYLICSLAMADTCVGIIGIPFVIVNNFQLPPHFYICLFMNCVIVCFTCVSVFNLVAIAIERFVAIKFPIFYRQNFQLKVSLVMMTLAWIFGITAGFVPMMGWHKKPEVLPGDKCGFLDVITYEYMIYMNFFAFILAPLCIIFLVYFYIFYILFKKSRQTAANASSDKDKEKMAVEARAARRISVVALVFAGCWLPLHILNCISYFTTFFNLPLLIIAIFLSHLNSAVNPFLYAWGNEKIRGALKKTLGMKNSVAPSGGTSGTAGWYPG